MLEQKCMFCNGKLDAKEKDSTKNVPCQGCKEISNLVEDKGFHYLLDTILNNNFNLELSGIEQVPYTEGKIIEIHTERVLDKRSCVSIYIDTIYGEIKFDIHFEYSYLNLKDLINFEIDLKRVLSLLKIGNWNDYRKFE